jgi:phosphoglycerate dehydrogenase-like enzyme
MTPTMDRQRPLVVVLGEDRVPPAGLRPLMDRASIRFVASIPELEEALADADVVFLNGNYKSPELRHAWANAPRLRWVHVAAVGVDTVLSDALARSEIVLTNSRGLFDQSIAEYVLGLMLAFAKDLPATVDLQRRHVWQHRDTETLAGKAALIVGAGGLGRAIGRMARAMGMRVTGAARSARPDDPDLGRIVAIAEIETALPEADYVVVALPLTPDTRGIFGAPMFGHMKASARFINVGRGQLVDESALVDAIRSRRIAGAALDVFVDEPLPADHPLWDLPGVIVSPHMSGDFIGWERALVEFFAEQFERWRQGRPPLNVVDKQRGYIPSHVGAEPDAAADRGDSAWR